jgi:acyl-homoserine lactone synthase
MIFIVNAENRRLFAAEIGEMHRQRKRVFVDAGGWKVPVVGDMEIDSYDRADTIYLIAKTDLDGPVLASVRLLPTVVPHLMSDLFLDACNGVVPRGPGVWEASRFCAMPTLESQRTRAGLLWEIICGVMETALLFGVEQITFVANAALFPLAFNCGWQAEQLGPTLQYDSDEITAVAVRITPEGLRDVRRRFGIAGPVTRFLTPTARVAA